MKLLSLPAIAILSSFLTAGAQDIVPFSDKRWVIQAQGSFQESYKGYPALYLQNGMAYLENEKFGNGIIEFDIYLSERTSFSGVIFRIR